MSDMVERVADAMRLAAPSEWSRSRWDQLHDSAKREWCARAKAAIAAMREPTAEMIRIGGNVLMDTDRMERSIEAHYQAMIDAALKDEGGENE